VCPHISCEYLFQDLSTQYIEYTCVVSAMCMEKLIDQGVRERTPQAEEMIIKYYEQAGDILLVYLQNRLRQLLMLFILFTYFLMFLIATY